MMDSMWQVIRDTSDGALLSTQYAQLQLACRGPLGKAERQATGPAT